MAATAGSLAAVASVTDNAELGDQGATVWVEATPLQLAADDNSARLDTAGCAYLSSTEMARNPIREIQSANGGG